MDNRWALPVEALRNGFYSAKYFVRAAQILRNAERKPDVLMQVFQRYDNTVLCGIAETIEILRSCAGRFDERGEWVSAWDDLTVHALDDGDTTNAWETVLTIEGDYGAFAHLESVYLGVLADRSGIATRTRAVVEAAQGKTVLFMGDRFKDFRTQIGDGYAVHIGGVHGVCTDAHGAAWGGDAGGTMPHALIAAYDGDTVAAAVAFAQTFPDVPVVA
ncbi:MAG: quinolinate phosphoribosyl transferase, partial [Armatimonadetes bacterium]|nr:quinolinate phosphoribosyl transferase [Armatimonadota bacterium]